MKTMLVGCGFLGSLFAEEVNKHAYALHEPLTWLFVDGDSVEDRNIANQGFDYVAVGKNKAAVLAERAKKYAHQATALRKRITKLPVWQADFLVDAVDNIETRQMLWREAIRTGLPLLHLGISRGGTGLVSWTVPQQKLDTFPLSPVALLGREIPKDPDDALPPCELIKFRSLGLQVASAGATALFAALGLNGPERFDSWTAGSLHHSVLEVRSQ